MAQEDLDAAESGLLSAIKSGNPRAIELFKGELARLQSGAPPSGIDPTPKTDAGAPATGTSGEEFIKGLRRSAGMIAGAPLRMVAGGADLLGLGINKAGSALGVPQENLPQNGFYSKYANKAADAIAGQSIGESTGRSALEAAIMAPLSGANTAVNAAKAIGSAATSGAVAHESMSRGMSPWAAIPLSVVAGHGTGAVMGKIPGMNGLTPAETFSYGKLKQASEGIPQAGFREGTINQMEAHGHEIPLLPSQALSTAAPELEALQAAMLSSRSAGGTKLRETISTQSNRVKQLVEGLKNIGGQTPRTDDLMAEGVKKLAQGEVKSRSEAVNDATRGLYQDPLGSSWKFNPQLGAQVDAGLTNAQQLYRSEPVVSAAIANAKSNLTGLLSNPAVTPVEVTNMIGHLKRNVLPDISTTSTSDLNRARAVVVELLTPLEKIAMKHAPALGEGQALQSSLRADLPGKFDEVTRTAAAGGGARGMLNTASQRPELISAVVNKDPQLAQEILQRTVNNAVDKSLVPGAQSGVQASNAGITAKTMLTDSLEGASLQKNLELLFKGHPDPKAAAEGFNRVLGVVANASKPTGGKGVQSLEPSFIQEAARGGAGSMPQRVNLFGRLGQTVYGQFRDNATVRVLTQPDVMDRLAYIASLPKVKLTPALLTATLPQLFQEPKNVP